MNRKERPQSLDSSWQLIILGVLLYVGLGLMVHYIPNPIVPSAIWALNMVVIVVAGHIGGPLAGALTGGIGTLLNFCLKLPMGGPDFYELSAVIPHTLMGLAAGLVRPQHSRLLTASTIAIGHGLNLLFFGIGGLLPWSLFRIEAFWDGLFAEIAVDLILIMVLLNISQSLRAKTRDHQIQTLPPQQLALIWSALLGLTAILVLLFYSGVSLSPYLFVLPVVLAAIYLGSLAAWVMALLLSFVLIGAISFAMGQGVDFGHEISMILVLNLIALAVGELAENLTTQRRLAQQRLLELKNAYAVMSEADRLKSEMIQNISHELRTPLAIILGHTELLITGLLGKLSEEQTNSITAAHKHARRLTYLVEQVTVLHQVEEGKLSWQAVAFEVLTNVQIERLRTLAAENKCQIRLFVEKAPLTFEGDPEYLGRAIYALLDNAIKFSVNGGLIEVRIWDDQERIYLAVSDKGIGIEPQQRAHLFQRFYQIDGSTTRRFGGLGTGLALVKEVVQAHGGDVWVESTVQQGSIFGLWIPVTPPEDRQHFDLPVYEQFMARQGVRGG